MIIRKPYAFLIKHFRKVHILLLIISLYVLYKVTNVSSFINDFMAFGTYDYFNDPITKHITIGLYIAIWLLVIIDVLLLLLLKRKEKPWKIYLVPVIEYIALFLILNMVTSFFKGFNNGVSTTDLRLSRDLLFMLTIGIFATIGIFVMRILGMDLNKFEFTKDEEFLELSEDDRDEVELRIKIDKNIFIRKYNKLVRVLKYFYLEHEVMCKALLGVFIIVIIGGLYKFAFITNKSYSEGEFYSANGYTIKVNNSYYTDKNYTGEIISKNSNFVVVDLTITNKSAPRTIYLENFHLKNGVADFVTTRKTYEKEFQDLGKTYDNVKKVKRDETLDMIIVFKVVKGLKQDNYSLYYQEKEGKLRKIKLNVSNISKIKDKGTLKLGESLVLKIKPKQEKISLDAYSFAKEISYTRRICNTEHCYTKKDNYVAEQGYSVLKIDFASINFEGKEMVDFSSDYGKINYIDNNKMEHSVAFKYPFNKKALGKSVYTLVPDEVAASETLSIVYVIRNEKYTYKLK
ncbi:MAG: hypothetical protein IKE63_02480 [Bacilli bacterium]|nr:hypothetical protein [Bacilli bacterium]